MPSAPTKWSLVVDAVGQRERNGQRLSQLLVRSFRELERCENLLSMNNLQVAFFYFVFLFSSRTVCEDVLVS